METEQQILEREQRQDLVLNPFAKKAPTAVGNAASDVAASRAVAEVQAAMIIAQRFPRNEVEATDKILNAFARTSLAEVAQYEYAKGGSDIRGPSIRSMEAIAQLWGHIHSGVEELDRRPGASTVRTFAFDAQTGSNDSKVFQVEHIRHTKNGSYRLEDPREIYEHVANQAARRKRACLTAVIPGDVIEAAMRQADLTLHTKAEVTPERLQALIEKFGDLGVSKEAIEMRIQRRLEAMSPAQMVNLGKIYNSLKDGMSVPADWFDLAASREGDGATSSGVPKPTRGAAGLKAAAAARAARKAAQKAPQAATYAEVRNALEVSVDGSAEAFDRACAMIVQVADEAQRLELNDVANRIAHQRADRAAAAQE